MTLASNTTRKKKKTRICKHVLLAKERQSKEMETQGTTTGSIAAASAVVHPHATFKKLKRSKSKAHEKDPMEVHLYLTSWKNRQLDANLWKFNKNTQSWLIRHMYHAEKVKKETFTLLVQYIVESPKDRGGATGGGGGLQQRILEDARRRAMRYREWEKKSDDHTTPNTTEASHKETLPNSDPKKGHDPKDTQNPINTKDMSPEDIDAKRWEALDAHDKRKEYKRARKVIEALSVP